jgi:23S rRNA (guanosine2251-2'-O)-methyltransferase
MSEKIYGRKPVLEALRSGARAVTHIYDHHQGAIAVVDAFKYSDLQDLLDSANHRNEPAFILLLDEIEDPHNLGAILRSADAAGVHGAVIPKNRAVEVNATVVKSSAGAAEHVATVKVTNLNDTIKRLKDANVWVVGTDAEATKNFYDYDYRQPVALVIGNEGKGLRRLVRENCDELVRIPMAGKVSSLNASVAAALLLFEVVRQRQWKPSGASPSASARTPVYPILEDSPIPSYGVDPSPPERDFFRSRPDPAPQTPDEGAPSGMNQPDAPEDPPGTDKGGGFRW